MNGEVGRLADALTVVVALVLLVLLGMRFLPTREEPRGPVVGFQIDGRAVGVDFGAVERTLLMVLRSDCRFCELSQPFYERLPLDGDVQVVIAAPTGDTGIKTYRELVQPDDVVFVDMGLLPVRGTPTLLLVDGEGRVEASWLGLLDTQREDEVLAALVGAQ